MTGRERVGEQRERKKGTDRHADKYSEEECVQRGVRNNGIVCCGGWEEKESESEKRERKIKKETHKDRKREKRERDG
jgi:hypothetical protein